MVTVLYVEDNFLALRSVFPIFESGGHKVRGAENGEKGLEVLTEEEAVDIIFTDFRMPVMDGYNFCKAVKTDPKYAKHSLVPIVGVGDFPDDKREHLVEYMPKPLNPKRLFECIAQYCK